MAVIGASGLDRMPANYNSWRRAPSLSESWYCMPVTPSGPAGFSRIQHPQTPAPPAYFTQIQEHGYVCRSHTGLLPTTQRQGTLNVYQQFQTQPSPGHKTLRPTQESRLLLNTYLMQDTRCSTPKALCQMQHGDHNCLC